MKQLILFLTILFLPLSAFAEKRLGLVIGNDTYDEVLDLQKARADALALADALDLQGFAVTLALDATRRDMNRTISRFAAQLEPGDTAFVFFAGHGVEIDGENYLLPTDIVAPTSGEQDFIKSESIPLSGLLDRIRRTGARTTLAIIDACRDNPFANTTGRSIGGTRGLGRIAAPEGTFVIFSAGAGQAALDRLADDDPSDNSVFTRLLLPRLSEPGLELRDMMSGLRRDVRDLARTVGHEQFPAYYDELLGQFYFIPSGSNLTVETTADSVKVKVEDDPIREDFALARTVNTAEAYDLFLERYGSREDDFTVEMARKLREGLAQPEDTQVAALAPAPANLSRREIIRRTQAQLNALGCDAGGADGIAGRRTLSAFTKFLAASKSNLSADDLGTQAALDAVNAKSGAICTATVASVPRTSTPTAVATPSYSLAGTWSWSSSCPLGIKGNGTTRYTAASGGTFTGRITSPVGPATTTVTLNGRTVSGSEDYGWIQNVVSGSLSADGRSMSLGISNGCRVNARKQ